MKQELETKLSNHFIQLVETCDKRTLQNGLHTKGVYENDEFKYQGINNFNHEINHFNFGLNFSLFNKYIGAASFIVNKRKKITWTCFEPIHSDERLKGNYIGTIVHMISLLTLIKDENLTSDYKIIHDDPSLERIAQLDHMGLSEICDDKEYEKYMNLGEYVKICVDYANSRGFNFKNPFEEEIKEPKEVMVLNEYELAFEEVGI